MAAKALSFDVGDYVVYPKHGVGRVIELVCGFLIAIGLFTRPAAFLASGAMAVAYWTVHAKMNLFPVNNMGDAAILYCFVFLYLVFAGAGPLSLDAARTGKAPPQD